MDSIGIDKLLRALDKEFPDPVIELNYDSEIMLLVAVILSAQCTDKRVNETTSTLFQKYLNVDDFANANIKEFEEKIKPCGFYKNKAKNILGAARMIKDNFGSRIPDTMQSLLLLPGVGRKTANLILGALYGKQTIVVDTHVKRVAKKLGLTRHTNPDKIEIDLQQILPNSKWSRAAHQLLLHGRYICTARKPQCHRCELYNCCPWENKTA